MIIDWLNDLLVKIIGFFVPSAKPFDFDEEANKICEEQYGTYFPGPY